MTFSFVKEHDIHKLHKDIIIMECVYFLLVFQFFMRYYYDYGCSSAQVSIGNQSYSFAHGTKTAMVKPIKMLQHWIHNHKNIFPIALQNEKKCCLPQIKSNQVNVISAFRRRSKRPIVFVLLFYYSGQISVTDFKETARSLKYTLILHCCIYFRIP